MILVNIHLSYTHTYHLVMMCLFLKFCDYYSIISLLSCFFFIFLFLILISIFFGWRYNNGLDQASESS